MSPQDYQRGAMRTCSIPYDRRQDKLVHALTGLCSEAGEAAGLWQKTYQGHPSPLTDAQTRKHLILELGDVLWMVAEAADALEVDLEEIMDRNLKKLRARYPEGFEKEKSIHRKEGDI